MSKPLEVFLKLGLSKADAEKLLSADENVTKDLKVDEIVLSVVNTQKKKFEEDGTMDEYSKKKVDQVLSSRNRHIKRVAEEFGIEVTNKEIDELPSDSKTDDLIKMVIQRFKDKKAPANNDEKDKEIEKLNAEILQYKDKVKKFEEEEIPKLKSQAQEQIEANTLELSIRSKFSKINNGKLVADEDVLYPGIKSQLHSKYDIRIKDGKEVVYEKGTDKVAYKDSKAVTVDAILEELSEPIRKKQEQPEKKRIPEGGGDGNKISTPGLKDAQQKLEEMKAKREATKP